MNVVWRVYWTALIVSILACIVFFTVSEPDKPVVNRVVVTHIIHVDVTVNYVSEPEYTTYEDTAYTADCRGCIGITKSGVDVRNTVYYEGVRIIAVDPDVIPLGSRVEVRLSNGFTYEATAQDTGGAIKGRRIDVLKADYDSAIKFGRQDVGIRILNQSEAVE